MDEETPFKKSDGKTSVKKPQFSSAQSQKSDSPLPRQSSKVDSLRKAIDNRNDMNKNASYKKSGKTSVKPNRLSTAQNQKSDSPLPRQSSKVDSLRKAIDNRNDMNENASYKKSGKTSVKANRLSTVQSQKSDSPLPRQSSKVDSLRKAIDNRNDMNKNASYKKSGKTSVKPNRLSTAQNQHSKSTSPRTRAEAQEAVHQEDDLRDFEQVAS